mmetsp:Transcript_24570/g.61463  ORF Transcript_24570/g.61463 Transcript_24570/m.61463 type:complete len:210 (+) Transcript_24570:591-1220(+)
MPERREQVALQDLPALLHLEVALVVIRLVPHPISQDEQNDKHGVVKRCWHIGEENQTRPSVHGEEHGLIAIQKRHAREVPPAQHPPELLGSDVPRVRDEVLALGTSIAVQAVREHHEGRRVRHRARAARCLNEATQRDEQEQGPRDACLGHHLDVHYADPRVQPDAHEEVVDAENLLAPCVTQVDDHGVDVSQDDRRCQESRVLKHEVS